MIWSIWYELYLAIQIHEESHSDDIFTTSQPSMSPVQSYGIIDSLTTLNPSSDTDNFTDSNQEYISKSEPIHTIERMIQDVRKRINGIICIQLIRTSSDSMWQWWRRIWNICIILSNWVDHCRRICYMEITHSFSKQT